MVALILAAYVTFRFTTPCFEDSACGNSSRPEYNLAYASLYGRRVDGTWIEQARKPIGPVGCRADSFVVVPTHSAYYLTTVDTWGNESCPSRIIEMNPTSVPPRAQFALPPCPYYDVAGRKVVPSRPGIYITCKGRKVFLTGNPPRRGSP